MGIGSLSALQQRIAAKRDDDFHIASIGRPSRSIKARATTDDWPDKSGLSALIMITRVARASAHGDRPEPADDELSLARGCPAQAIVATPFDHATRGGRRLRRVRRNRDGTSHRGRGGRDASASLVVASSALRWAARCSPSRYVPGRRVTRS
jgi:hypothetical protein